jgi:hypothetical protein
MWTEDTVPKEEVQKMCDALSEAFANILKEKTQEYRFAKFISYLSLILSTLIIAMEVFK